MDATVKDSCCTALHLAVKRGHVDIVRTLLEVVAELLTRKALTSVQSLTQSLAIHAAAANGHVHVVVELVKHGMDVYARTEREN